jgi:hypothetical protein
VSGTRRGPDQCDESSLPVAGSGYLIGCLLRYRAITPHGLLEQQSNPFVKEMFPPRIFLPKHLKCIRRHLATVSLTQFRSVATLENNYFE